MADSGSVGWGFESLWGHFTATGRGFARGLLRFASELRESERRYTPRLSARHGVRAVAHQAGLAPSSSLV